MAQQKIYSAIINNEKIYVKAYKKQNAIRFFNKKYKNINITKKDVNIEKTIDGLSKIYDELYPELKKGKKNYGRDNKYYNMFK